MSKTKSFLARLMLVLIALAAVLGAWMWVWKPMKPPRRELPQVEIPDVGPPFGTRREYDLELRKWGHDRVQTICFSPDSRAIVAGTHRAMLHVVDLQSGATRALEAHRAGNTDLDITAIAFSPNGKRMLSADTGGRVRVWEWPSLAEVRVFDQGNWVGDALFRTDDEIISSLWQYGQIKSLSVRTGAMRPVFDVYESRHYRPKEHLRPLVGRMALVGDLLAAAVSETIYFVDLRTGADRRQEDTVGPLDLARVGAGRELAAADPGGVWVLDAGDGRVLRTLRTGTRSEVNAIAASPDGRTLAVASYFLNELPGVLQTWDWRAGKIISQHAAHTGPVYSMRYSPCGKYLAHAGHDGIVMVDTLESAVRPNN